MTGGDSSNADWASRLAGTDPRVFTFIDAWRAARRGKLVPFRQDFDPTVVPGLLGSVWLYRYEPELGDFVCRLAGEAIKAAWGGNLTGRTLREIIGEDDYAVVIERWRRIMAGPLIQYGAAAELGSDSQQRRVERLVMPLASESGEIDHMLGLSLYALSSPTLTRTILVPGTTVQIPCAEL
ncbi:MAG: PAS domain-containing protein [Thalassobaculum sp.]|uniref:PAS domain-containing protein n=1 Tax=Thalassobaculum sp. TaxID=2022740 RepID=UPI0032EE8F70